MRYATMRGRKLLILGFGSLGPAVLPLVLKHIDIKLQDILIVAAERRNFEKAYSIGVSCLLLRLTRQNFYHELERLLRAGDVLLNVSVGVSSQDLIEFCRCNGVLYLDTNTEDWIEQKQRAERTTLARRKALLCSRMERNNAPTALVCHGINPGLVSHFVKRALIEINRNYQNASAPVSREREYWASLARSLRVHSIHVAERDSQASRSNPTLPSNTWSLLGLADELQEPAAFAVGSRDADVCRSRPGSDRHNRVVELQQSAHVIVSESWTPSVGGFRGFLVPHPEVFSIADYLTIRSNRTEIGFRPTVKFIYKPCDAALLGFSVKPMTDSANGRGVLLEEIDYGADEVGVLIMMEGQDRAFWFGSKLDIDTARHLAPHNNATSLQTAAGILGGLIWLLENPKCGIVEPEEVNFEMVLQIAAPYLGDVGGHWTRWCPPQPKSIGLPDRLARVGHGLASRM